MSDCPIRFFKVVFPALPVIPIMWADEFSLVFLANSFKAKNVFLTLITLLLETILVFLLIMHFAAPLLIASFKNLCPSFFLPFIAKNK